MENDTVFIVSESRTNSENAITKNYGSFFMAMEIERESGLIVEFGCTHTLSLTEDFLRKIFVGKNIKVDFEQLKKDVTSRYCGSSVKAILVALADINKRYLTFKKI